MAVIPEAISDLRCSIPTQDYRRTDYRVPSRPLSGLDAVVNGVIGKHQRRTKVGEQLRLDAGAIDSLAGEWTALTDHDLQTRLLGFRDQFRRGKISNENLISGARGDSRSGGSQAWNEAVSGSAHGRAGAASWLSGGNGDGRGENFDGRVGGDSGRLDEAPCHMVTVNDYLVQRDAEWLEPLYHFCGVRVGLVAFWMGPPERMKNYGCDVTYVTSKELLADFFRDRLYLGKIQNPSRRLIRRMSRRSSRRARNGIRGLHTAIVDEADSVLIDEAVTPLIIAATAAKRSLARSTRNSRTRWSQS